LPKWIYFFGKQSNYLTDLGAKSTRLFETTFLQNCPDEVQKLVQYFEKLSGARLEKMFKILHLWHHLRQGQAKSVTLTPLNNKTT
jgi:hypothetical protein